MELTIAELKKKRVVNLADGKELGRVIDVSFSYPSGSVTGLVITSKRLVFNGDRSLLKLCCIEKIGTDTILVKVVEPTVKQVLPEMDEYE